MRKKSRIRETLNLLTFADSSIDTKTDSNGQKKQKKKKIIGMGANIRIGRKIQCLPYAGFLLSDVIATFSHPPRKVVILATSQAGMYNSSDQGGGLPALDPGYHGLV